MVLQVTKKQPVWFIKHSHPNVNTPHQAPPTNRPSSAQAAAPPPPMKSFPSKKDFGPSKNYTRSAPSDAPTPQPIRAVQCVATRWAPDC